MPKYQLKPNQPAFEMVDGPLAGRKYAAGQDYEEIPPGEAGRFEEIKEAQGARNEDKGKPRTLNLIPQKEVTTDA